MTEKKTPDLKAETRKKMLHLGGTLFLVTAVTGLILGLVEWRTRIAIEKAQAEAKAEALRNVLPEAEAFAAVPLADGASEMIVEVQQGTKGDATAGWCLSVSSKPLRDAGPGGPLHGAGVLRPVREQKGPAEGCQGHGGG